MWNIILKYIPSRMLVPTERLMDGLTTRDVLSE